MSHGALGNQFAEHIAAFRDRYHEEGYHEQECAEGNCHAASTGFKKILDNAGVENHVEEYVRPYSWDDGEEGDIENHFVNVVKRPRGHTVVDWTARQFDGWDGGDPVSPYPVVQPRSAYRRKGGWKDSPWNEDGSRK